MFLDVLAVVVTLPLVFAAPGLFLYRSRLFGSWDISWIERVLMVVGLSVAVTSLTALFMAEVGLFNIWLLDAVLAAVCLVVRIAFGGVSRPVLFYHPSWLEIAVLVFICAISVGMFFRPAEYVAGDGDPGYYLNTGDHIASEGKVDFRDEEAAEMTDAEFRLFYDEGIIQFVPLHIRNRQTGRIQALLYHLLPVWIAVFAALFGTMGGLYVVPVFALLGVLVVFALGRRFAGVAGGSVAALLLSVFFLQVWFARMPISEIFCQFFILAAILFFVVFLESRGVLAGLAAALSATAAATARPEAVLLFVPFLVVMGVELFRKTYGAAEYVFVNSLFAGLVYIWVYVRFAQYYYFHTNVRKVVKLLGPQASMDTFLLAFALLIGAGLIIFNLRQLNRLLLKAGSAVRRKTEPSKEKIFRALRTLLGFFVVILFAYFYFYAPGRAETVYSPQKFFFYSTVFLGGTAVFVLVAGLALMVYRSNGLGGAFTIAFIVAAYMLAFTESSITAGRLPWLARRYMPVVIPFLFVGFGYLVYRFFNARDDLVRSATRTAAVLITAGFLAFFCFCGVSIYNRTEYRGIDNQLDALAGEVDGDVVLFTDAFLGESLGLPLRYRKEVDTRRLFALDDPIALTQAVQKYNEQGKDVFVEASGLWALEPSPALFDFLSFEKAFDFEVTFPRLSRSYTSRPDDWGIEEHDMVFFRLVPKV